MSSRGSAPVELSLGLGLLVFPVLMLVVAIPSWPERQGAARVLARDVARATARSGVCDDAGATRLAREASVVVGVPEQGVEVDLDCAPGRLPRTATVAAEVTVSLPVVVIPGMGSFEGGQWTARHVEVVDPFRSIE